MLATAKRMSESGYAEIYESRQGEEVVASDFVFLVRDCTSSYLDGANEYALRRFRMSALFVWNLNVAHEWGSSTVNLLRGDEQQKLRWNPKLIPNYRLILGRQGRILFAAYAASCLLRTRVNKWVQSENAAPWARSAAHQLRDFSLG